MRFYISFEGFSIICFLCGVYGHAAGGCLKLNVEKTVDSNGLEGHLPVRTVFQDGFTVVKRGGRREQASLCPLAGAVQNPRNGIGKN